MAKQPPSKGHAMPKNEHWERHYKDSYTKDTKHYAGSDWNPKKSTDRTCTHEKVNKEDH